MKKEIIKRYPFFLLLFLGGMLTGCGDLLEVENPNNIVEEALDDPRAFNAMVNGAEASATRAFANIVLPYAEVCDEVVWIGSRDAWQQLNFGNIADINNEFTDAAFFFVAEARWWTDQVVKRGEDFNPASINVNDLVRAYLYAASTYTFTADMFDDFVISSNKTEPGPPVGDAKMSTLYDVAIGYLQKANAAQPNNFAVLSMLARVHHAKGVWAKVNPVNTNAPLVASAEAAGFAAQALAAASNADSYFKLNVIATARPGGLPIASEINSRLESRLSDLYVISDGKKVKDIDSGDPAKSISLKDPIDNIPDPALYRIVKDFATSVLDFDFTMSSSREMHLILAEHALATNDTNGFTTHINNLRALDGLTPYSGQIPAIDMLKHARRVNLFLQGRRLSDHYRFNDPSPYWIASSVARTNPGTFFPIPISEIRANPFLQ